MLNDKRQSPQNVQDIQSPIMARIEAIRNKLPITREVVFDEGAEWSQFSQWADAPSNPWGKWGK
jgi:hypothetical protein